MINVREIKTREDYESHISGEGLRIVKVGATWCGPCHSLDSTIQNLDESRIGDTLFASLDIEESDDNEAIATELGIRNIPVMLYIVNGEVMDRTVGAVSSADIYNRIIQNTK